MLLFLSCVIMSCSSSYSKYSSTERLISVIEAEMKQNNIPSMSVGIVDANELVWSHSFDQSSIGHQETKSNDSTIYLLASLSKLFVATAIMQLYESNQLDLDTDINNYLPFSVRNPYYKNVPITTRMLLTHTSSLSWPTNKEDPDFNTRLSEASTPKLGTWVEKHTSIAADKDYAPSWKNSKPGTRHQYSNIGGAVLGLIVENVSGMDFNQYCKEYIFNKLNMTNSGFKLDDVNENYLINLIHDGKEIPQYSVPHYPSSTLKSSVKELSNFLIAILNNGNFNGNKILNPDTVDMMLEIQIPDKNQALIWKQFDKDWIGHIGGYWGSSTTMDINKEKKVGVIILSNVYGQEIIYPNGLLYKLIHKEAKKYIK